MLLRTVFFFSLLFQSYSVRSETSASLITNTNRKQNNAMMGGWGPHLRPILTTSQGDRWMVVDSGNNVLVNSALRYFSFRNQRWTLIATTGLPATIQQNMGSILVGNYILSYGVNIANQHLVECYFDTTKPSYRACNDLIVSGQVFNTGANANYVGAAVSPDGTRLVWYTQVASSSNPGIVRYLYNHGGGWNGPYSITLGGWGDFAYIYASFKSAAEVVFGGQLYLNGAFRAGYAQFKLGNSAAVQTPVRLKNTSKSPDSSEDIYFDPISGRIHWLARTLDGRVAYFSKLWQEAWSGHRDSYWILPSSMRARFRPSPDGSLSILVSGSQTPTIEVRTFASSDLAYPLDWIHGIASQINVSTLGMRSVSAIYVGNRSYQNTPLGIHSIAVCGNQWEKDNEIWEFR